LTIVTEESQVWLSGISADLGQDVSSIAGEFTDFCSLSSGETLEPLIGKGSGAVVLIAVRLNLL
jgi:hypothetical protein